MKKALLIGLVIGVLAIWSVPAMAIDWSATGWIGVGFLYDKNIPSGNAPNVPPFSAYGAPLYNGSANANWNAENEYWQMRGRLMLKAQASPDLYGVFHFEIDSTMWGETANAPGGAGRWTADAAAVEVKHLYIDFRVPPQLPIWLRIGVQPYVVRPDFLYYVDGAGVSARIIIDPIKLMIRPFWGREIEGMTYNGGDDADMLGVDVSVPIGPAKVGMYFLYEDTRNYDTMAVTDASNVWWIGAYADMKIGPVKVAADFAYDDGKYNAPAAANEINYSGWGARVVADATFGIFNVGLGGLYYSGGDVNDMAADNDYGWFIRPRGNEVSGTLDDSVVFGGWGSWYGPGTGHPNPPNYRSYHGSFAYDGLAAGSDVPYEPSMSGLWGVRGFAGVQATSWLKIMAQLAYWGDNTKHGDTYGNAAGDHNQIGWEYDIALALQLYKNLMFKSAFGYLDAGGALRQANGGKPNDLWAWHSSLIYTF